MVCHNKLTHDFEALKPYVCESKLCAYQYYSLNRGPSLEVSFRFPSDFTSLLIDCSQYEIVHNPQTVDLLVSLAHSAATEQVLDDPLPTGLGLRVPVPDSSKIQEPARHFYGPVPVPPMPPPPIQVAIGPDGLCDFDDLTLQMVRFSL